MSSIESADPTRSRRASDPRANVMQRAYRVWAPVYDVACGRLFLSSRKAAASLAAASGRRILEVGVGTGLSLADYGHRNAVFGIDLSPEMIARARARAAKGSAAHIGSLEVMDAHHLAFGDATFDAVVAQFVITLVSDAERVLDEAWRVTAPGGEIILVNHFYSERGLAAWLERHLAPAAHRLGLRPDFPFGRITAWIERMPGARLIERRASGPFGWFSIVRIGKSNTP